LSGVNKSYLSQIEELGSLLGKPERVDNQQKQS